MCFLSRSVRALALVGQAIGVALGGSNQPTIEQLADGCLNVIEAVKESARELGWVDAAFVMRGLNNRVLDLGELHSQKDRARTGGASFALIPM